jgi:hypothetical protein
MNETIREYPWTGEFLSRDGARRLVVRLEAMGDPYIAPEVRKPSDEVLGVFIDGELACYWGFPPVAEPPVPSERRCEGPPGDDVADE